jgi:hypothetical protein
MRPWTASSTAQTSRIKASLNGLKEVARATSRLDTSTLSASQRAVSWTFSLVDQATISISLGETRASDRELDTVMYLYQQGASGNWGRYIERNDDTSESNLWSTLSDVQLGEGTFRIVVKGYSNSDRGAFKVGVSCDGAGCVAAEPTDSKRGSTK